MDWNDAPTMVVLTNKDAVSRKSRECSWCGGPIEAGEKYRRLAFTEDGAFVSQSVHLNCYHGHED